MFESFSVLLHGIILSESQISCKRIAKLTINGKSQQSLSYFLGDLGFDFDSLQRKRLESQLHFSDSQRKKSHQFLIIDDYNVKKRKNKKTQGAGYNYSHETGGARKSQCIVSSSMIRNGTHIPYKHQFYVGKKYISKNKFRKKTDMAIDLMGRFSSDMDKKKSFKDDTFSGWWLYEQKDNSLRHFKMFSFLWLYRKIWQK